MKGILDEIRAELKKRSDDAVRISGEGFFKEGVKLYGIRNAEVHSMSREFFKKLPDKSKATIFSLCDELWGSGYNEEAFIACNWSYASFSSASLGSLSTWRRSISRYSSS